MATLATEPNEAVMRLIDDLERSRAHVATLASELDEARRTAAHDRAILRVLGVRYGDKLHGDEDSGVHWWAFPGTLSDERIMEALELAGVAVEGWDCHTGDWDCCGRIFARSVWIMRKGSRALAHQSWGRDV